eukprot:scaffold36113_cov62-Phaeocystis_antarctica.AAC.1
MQPLASGWASGVVSGRMHASRCEPGHWLGLGLGLGLDFDRAAEPLGSVLRRGVLEQRKVRVAEVADHLAWDGARVRSRRPPGLGWG